MKLIGKIFILLFSLIGMYEVYTSFEKVLNNK